ncbi:MAG: SprB repeat-containing protein, partial [Bacteroidota bacterium]
TNGCTLAVNDVLVEDLCPLGCTAEGGTIRNNSASVFCVDDGQMDMIEIEVNGNNGNYKYALTSANGRIERVSDDPAMDLEGTGGGLAMFYGVAYEGAIIGLESGEDINELEGCYSLSNSIVVNRLTGQNCLANCALPKVKDIVKFTATCGEANGQVRIEMAGDNAAYTYNWSPNIGTASGNIRSDLPSGGYSVSIADINDPNCFEVIRFALGNSDGPDPIALTTAAVCQQANGTAQLNPVAFTYQWEDNTMTNNRNDLAPGTYLVTATDNTQGCSTVLEVEVGSQNNLEATLTLNSPATCQQANGSATINVSGGTGNYSYSWAGGATRNDLTAGIYHVVISDNNAGCETTITFAVTEEVAGVDIDLPSTRLLTCAGDEDAFVSYTLTPQPGLAFPLREEIQNIAGTVVNNGSLGAGDYCVLVYDANDCLAGQACFEVIEPNPIVVDIFATPASCTALGAISLVATGGHSAFIYDWADIPGAFNQRDRSDLAAGTYALTITDGRNCEVVLPNLMVEDDCNTGCQVMAGMISSNSPNTFCVDDGQADLFEVLVSGNTGNYLFVITDTNAEILALSTNNQINFEGSGPGIVLVYGFAFDGPVDGLAVGETLAGLSGCFELTEPLAVTRLTGTDCQGTCIEPTVTNLIIVEASCNNADGQVTIELAGSPFQYDYIWAPNVSNTNEATGLVAGDYTVTITDPSVPNCFTITSFTVGNIDGPQANLFTVPATCLASNGAASFSPTNLTYTWADLFVGPERNDLAAGDYDVTISDGSSTCINVVMVSIDSNNPLSLAVQINALPGCQQANGSATILVSGGTNNYSYSWGAGPTQDNLAAGTYTVTVVDNGSGCEQSITFSLQDAVSEATITIPAQVSISCAGANDGEIDVQFTTNSNFPGPAVVEIVDANGILQNNGSLSPGNYCVIIRDANNCVAGQSCFEVIEPDAINLDIAIVDRECNSPGMIMLNVTGGTAPYTYDWQDLPGNADPEDRIDLAAGFYSVTVLDNQNCSVSSINLQLVDNCIINCTPPQIINIISQDATCNNTDGAIELDLVGDESDYVYTWSPNVSTSNSASNLSAGVYRLTITDINDPTCFSTENILINNLDGPVVDVVSSTPANCGQANGAASLSPNSFNYIWCNGATGSTVSGLPAGICYVTVTDPADGCTDVVEVLIDEIGLQASANILQQPDCGAANGLVTIQVNGGSNNYNYAWSDGGSGADRSDLSAGIYQVSITDNVNPACIFELIFTLTDQAVAAAFIDIISPGGNTSVSCAGTSDATIDFNLGFDVGFVQPASTEIVDGLGNVQVNGNLAPGNYCILVRDGQGCLAGEACFEVLSPDAISLDLVLADKTCTTAGQINLTTSGGTAPYQYNWADLAGNNNAEDRDDLEAGIYSVTVSDANACSLVADGLVIGSDCPNDCVLPVIANIVKINASCEEDNGSIFIALTDNSINYQYNWLPNVSSSNQASGLASG